VLNGTPGTIDEQQVLRARAARRSLEAAVPRRGRAVTLLAWESRP
jgi:hypothetical protein